jgi:hypothetical protein
MTPLPNPIIPGLYTTRDGPPALVYSISDDNDEYPVKALTTGRLGVVFEEYYSDGRYLTTGDAQFDLVALVKPAAELPVEFAERVKNYLEATSTAANLSRALNTDLKSYATP